MSDIVNLRRWKKRKAREQASEQAAQNRAISSIPGKVKKQGRDLRKVELAQLAGKKLESKKLEGKKLEGDELLQKQDKKQISPDSKDPA